MPSGNLVALRDEEGFIRILMRDDSVTGEGCYVVLDQEVAWGFAGEILRCIRLSAEGEAQVLIRLSAEGEAQVLNALKKVTAEFALLLECSQDRRRR